MAGRFISDALASVLVRVCTMAAGLASSMVTARALGPEGRGIYFYVLTIALLATQFGSLGQHAWSAYRAAVHGEDTPGLLRVGLWQSLLVAPPLALVIIVVMHMAGSGSSVGRVALVAAAIAPAGLFMLLACHILVGLGRIGQYNRAQLLASVAPLMLVSLAAAWRPTPGWMLAATACGGWVAGAIVLRWLGRGAGKGGSAAMQLLRAGLGFSARAFVVTCLSFVFVRVNVLILERAAPTVELGLYSIGAQFLDSLVILPASVALVLFPRLAAQGHGGFASTARIAAWVGLLAVGTATVLWVALPWIVPLVFGAEFVGAVYVTRLLLPAVVAMSVTSIFSQLPAARGYPPVVVAAWIVALFLHVALALWLVPAHGAAGAAVSLSLAAAVACVSVAAIAWRVGRQTAAST